MRRCIKLDFKATASWSLFSHQAGRTSWLPNLTDLYLERTNEKDEAWHQQAGRTCLALVHQCEAAAVASVGAKLPFKRDTNTNTNTNNTDTNKQQVGSKLSEKMVPLLSSSILGAADRHPTPCHALTSNCNYKYRKKYKYQLKRKYKYKKQKKE